VGTVERFKNTPYISSEIDQDSPIWRLINMRLRRFARRLAIITATVGEGKYDTLDIGDRVRLESVAFIDPVTGDRLGTSESLLGIITSVKVDWHGGVSTFTMIVTTGTEKLALMSPCAEVVGYNPATGDITVQANSFTRPTDALNDAEHFTALDSVALVDSNGLLVSDDGATFPTLVFGVTPTTVNLASHMRDGVGANILAMTAGWIVCFATYDAVNSGQQDVYAHVAEDTTAIAPRLGAAQDAAYVYGD
jgi:hypothetical protein